jgi:hypothetical protein
VLRTNPAAWWRLAQMCEPGPGRFAAPGGLSPQLFPQRGSFAAACGECPQFAAACGGRQVSPHLAAEVALSPHLAAQCRVSPHAPQNCGKTYSAARSARSGQRFVLAVSVRDQVRYLACLANETARISLMSRPADDSVTASLEVAETCTAVECCLPFRRSFSQGRVQG